MVFPIAKKLTSALVAAGGAFMVMAASPAVAQDGASQSPLGDGDAQFRELFADWQQLDRPAGLTSAALKVAVPSRMPVEGVRLSSDFGMREHPVLGGRRAHKGVDLAGPTGTPVYATADGTVDMAQWFSSYGNYVQIEHGAGLETRYGHLSAYTVQAGQKVKKGDLIGYIGSTGRSTGPHLHYEVRVDGVAVNPMPYMIETSAQQAFALARGEGGQGGPE
ncbi:MAG: M23 family metallopeptidase [Novosphingobium sp.]|nr:M23 family metallopeptidase [Novosphingobium sp.]